MRERIRLDNIIKSKSAAGLEIILQPDGGCMLNLVILKKQKSTLLTEKHIRGISDLKEIRQLIEPKTPVILIINGKGVIHRKIRGKENDTLETLLHKVLPNANADDFVVQKTLLNSEETYLSVIRKDTLHVLLQELMDHKLTTISSCFLGPFVITNLLPLLEKDIINNEQLNIPNFSLHLQHQQLTDVEVITNVADEHILVANDALSTHLLIAFAGALSYFTGNLNDILNSVLLNQLKEEFRQKQKFEFRSWALLLTAFLVLMINYIVFNNYWTKNNEMNAQLELTQAALKRYSELKTDYDQKKQFLELNGLLENSRTSFYADRLAKDLPGSIQFTGLNIHPLKKKNPAEEDKGLAFETKLIHVAGNCKRNTELNEWMKEMKNQGWVKDLVLMNYKQDNMNENGIFLIEIKLN